MPFGMPPSTFAYSLVVFVVMWFCVYHRSHELRMEQQGEVHAWLKQNGLWRFRTEIYDSGCTSVAQCVTIWSATLRDFDKTPVILTASTQRILKDAAEKMYWNLLLKQWLQDHDLEQSERVLQVLGISSLKDLKGVQPIESFSPLLKSSLSITELNSLSSAIASFPASDNEFNQLTVDLWKEVLYKEKTPWSLVGIMIISLIAAASVGMATTMSQAPLLHDHSTASKLGFLSYLTGKYLAPQNCQVEFDWTEPQVVGSTMSFVVKFFQRNGCSYPICNEDNVLIEVTQGNHKVACSVELGGTQPSDANKAKVQFSVRRAGDYHISVLIGMVHIRGSPFIKKFLPGPPDPLKTSFVHHCSTVVCIEDISSPLYIEPRDRYGNQCHVSGKADPSEDYSIDILETSSGRPVPNSFRWECEPHAFRVALVLKFAKEGCYHAAVSYKGQNLQNGDFHIIVLNKEEAQLVQKNVAKKNNWYEAKLLTVNGERLSKPKKVYCYISPKQLTIKEYMWKIIPKHIITFRLCPSTKFQFQSRNNYESQPILVVDDGSQPEVELISEERNVIAATFTQFLLKNIGGSETFKDKQDFFNHEVRKYHQKHFHDKLTLKIQRDKLLESSFKATKGFNTSEWCKNFEINFVGEEGLDWGGLRREWFELICSALFDPANLLFHTFKSDKQGLGLWDNWTMWNLFKVTSSNLEQDVQNMPQVKGTPGDDPNFFEDRVHPNPSSKRPSNLKLKYYEFAGKVVGKCLYESALGSCYRQLVKAKFSRSFLAQLIGLRVHYKYFEHDDPDLYVSKVRYILENDVDSMGLYFVEEEYSPSGKLLEEAELVSGGSRLPVTNLNKLQYLDALAQYRLANSIKDEIEYFLKGLNELIPDNLLCIFDENELELLMCGTGNYSIADFKANHAVSGSSYEFRKVMEWFWTAISNFTEEEMARLLQFTTGCSQLPPGGFAELSPKFHITAAPTFGNLPTAHTCFNQLCLPDYDSYEQFERALRLAINEGSEGFGMI